MSEMKRQHIPEKQTSATTKRQQGPKVITFPCPACKRDALYTVGKTPGQSRFSHSSPVCDSFKLYSKGPRAVRASSPAHEEAGSYAEKLRVAYAEVCKEQGILPRIIAKTDAPAAPAQVSSS